MGITSNPVPGILFQSLTSWSWGLWLRVWRLRLGTWPRTPLLYHTVDTWLYTRTQAGTETVKIHIRSNSVSTTQRYETQFFLKILTLTVVLSNYKYFKVHSQWKYLFSSCDIWYEIAYQGSNHIFSKLSEIENSTVHIYMALCLQLLQAVIHRDEHSSLTPSTSEKSEIYSYFTNYHLCNVQNMKSKFIVMCRTSKNTQFIIKFSSIINVYWS